MDNLGKHRFHIDPVYTTVFVRKRYGNIVVSKRHSVDGIVFRYAIVFI